MRSFRIIFITMILLLGLKGVQSQTETKPAPLRRFDLSKDPVLYTVVYAHLDTEWRWDYQETVNNFIKATLDDNFRLLEKYLT